MKLLSALLFLAFACNIGSVAMGQCQDIVLADSSFEDGLFTGGGPPVPGFWFRSDGCEISGAVSHSGDSSACSISGGGYQYVPVEPNTSYYLSCFVFNAANETNLHFSINWIPQPVSTTSNNWSFISQSFNSGTDTIVVIGFHSDGACFDDFRLTCSPLTEIAESTEPTQPYTIFSSISAEQFHLNTDTRTTVTVLDFSGRQKEQFQTTGGSVIFGENLPSAPYILKISTKKGVWFEKILKY